MKTINFKNQKMEILLILFLVLAFFTGCGIVDPDGDVRNNNYSAVEPFSFTIDAANKSKLKINSVNGPIEIYGVSGISVVKISGEKKVDSDSEADAEAHLRDLDVKISGGGDEIFVETEQPNETNGRSYSVYFKIEVPENWKIETDLTNGEVYIDTLHNDVDIDLTNGNVILQEVDGNVHVDVTNGQIDSKLTMPAFGTFDMETTNGAINLAIPKMTSSNLSAQVTNGNVRISELAMTNMTTTSKKVVGKLGNGEGSIKLKTTNGNINITGF